MTDQTTAAAAVLAAALAPPQKSGGAAGALWFFLAGFGGPWWYLGRPGSAIVAFLAYSLCAALMLVGVGFVLLPILWAIDGLAVASTLKKHNRERNRILTAGFAAAR